MHDFWLASEVLHNTKNIIQEGKCDKLNFIKIKIELGLLWASLVAQMVKNLPAMWETQVQSLGREDPLEKGAVTHSSILAWRIPWTEEPGRLQSIGSQRVGQD